MLTAIYNLFFMQNFLILFSVSRFFLSSVYIKKKKIKKILKSSKFSTSVFDENTRPVHDLTSFF